MWVPSNCASRPLGVWLRLSKMGLGWPLSSVEDGSCPVNGLFSATGHKCGRYRSHTVAEDEGGAQALTASSLCCP